MFRCKLCDVSVSGRRNFEMHLSGKKHRLRMHLASDNGDDEFSDAESFKPWSQDFEVPDIAPGEPIPPGLEDIVENLSHAHDDENVQTAKAVIEDLPDPEDYGDKVCQIQDQLDAHGATLIGLDFLVEATIRDGPEKLEYFCLLCDKKGPKRIAISHVMTFNHQLKYLKAIFPTLTRHVSKRCTAQTPKSVVSAIVNKVCTKIESVIGRFKPPVVDRDILVESKSQYTELIIQKHASRVKDMKVKELIEIVNKGADKHESKKEAEGEGRKDSEKKDGDEQLLTNKADEDSDDIEVLSVVSKVKLLVDITKEDEDGSTEKKESVKDDISGAAKERKESSQAGGSNHTGESKGGHLRRSLSNLSSISSISSPERSMVEIPRSPRSNMERRLPRRYSPGRPRKSFHQNPAHRSTYIRGRYMDRIPRRPRSGTRSKSRSISRSRSRSISPARSSKSSSGSRSYSMARNRAVLRRINRLRSRSPIRLRSRSPIILRSRSPLRLRSRSPIRLRSRSPIRLRSRSPIRLRSRSPVRLRSRSPMKRRSRSPLRLRSRSPIRLRSRSPLKLRSRSPIRLRSRSPIRLRSRSPIRLSVSPKRNPRRHGSPRLSPSRYRDRQRSKGLPVKGDAERRNRGGHIDDRSGKSDPHTKPEFQVSVWEKFRIEADELEIEMAASRRRYERSPEKHPRYAAEWKLFYSRRMEEAKGHRNLDPRSEEFKLEWIGFWGEKMNDLLNQEFRERKDAIRKRLGLPDEPPPYELKKRYEKRPPPIEAEDDWIPPPPRRLTDRVSPSMPEPLPISTERKPVTVSDLRSTWRALTGGNIEANVLPRNPNAEFEEHWCDSDVGLIPTLRIISALEEQLGSLGPRVNSHLSSALALQRGGGSLIPLIYSSDIIVLFETVKEKLLGQLQTGIVRKTMVSAVENAICSISNLLEKASRYRYPIKSEKVDGTISGSPFDFDSAPRMQPQLKEAIESFTDRLILASSQKASMISKPEPVEDAASVSIKPESVESAPVVIPGIGEVNKDAIAQHIAMALIERGRTDVTETELLRLIEEVVGLAQAQVPEDTAPREGCMSSQEDFYRNAVEGQGAGGNSSLNDLMARVCDRACMSETTPSQPLDDQGEPKYSLIAVDLDDDPCQKMYQKVSGETVLTTQDQQGSEGRAEPGEIKSLLRRFHYLTEDEQVSIAKYIKDHEAELPEEFDLLNRMLMHRGPVEELEKEKSSFPLGSPSDRRNNSSPVVETSAARAVPDELGEFMTPDSSALEMRLGLGNQGESLASMKRDDMDLAREANHGRNTPRTSLNEQYNDEQFRERSYSHGSAQGNYNYSRDEDPRHQLASNHSGDYVQPQSLPYDDRDYINMHGSGNGRRQEAMPEVSETSYRDYYRERSHSDVYDVQDNLNPNIRMRQYHDGGNPDPVQDYNERLYYQQQMALNSDFGGRDPRNYRNYPSGDYYDY